MKTFGKYVWMIIYIENFLKFSLSEHQKIVKYKHDKDLNEILHLKK